MDSLVIAIYRKKNPSRPNSNDSMVWHRDIGYLVLKESLAHGLILWAESEGRQGKSRLKMMSCDAVEEIVFPEKFVRRKSEITPWSVIKRRVTEFFQGRKPKDLSWNQAKRRVDQALQEEPWPRLMLQHSGVPASSS